jgi:hypothetical protein
MPSPSNRPNPRNKPPDLTTSSKPATAVAPPARTTPPKRDRQQGDSQDSLDDLPRSAGDPGNAAQTGRGGSRHGNPDRRSRAPEPLLSRGRADTRPEPSVTKETDETELPTGAGGWLPLRGRAVTRAPSTGSLLLVRSGHDFDIASTAVCCCNRTTAATKARYGTRLRPCRSPDAGPRGQGPRSSSCLGGRCESAVLG